MSCERVAPTALSRATEHCRLGRVLSEQEAESLVGGLSNLDVEDSLKVDFLLAWAAKGETGGELAGM